MVYLIGAAITTFLVKIGFAQMLRGGVIMDVVNAEQACVIEVGACTVMALKCIPADICAQGSISR